MQSYIQLWQNPTARPGVERQVIIPMIIMLESHDTPTGQLLAFN